MGGLLRISEGPLYRAFMGGRTLLESGVRSSGLQGYLAHKGQPPTKEPPQGPRHNPPLRSYGGAVSYERGTPVRPLETLSVPGAIGTIGAIEPF